MALFASFVYVHPPKLHTFWGYPTTYPNLLKIPSNYAVFTHFLTKMLLGLAQPVPYLKKYAVLQISTGQPVPPLGGSFENAPANQAHARFTCATPACYSG